MHFAPSSASAFATLLVDEQVCVSPSFFLQVELKRSNFGATERRLIGGIDGPRDTFGTLSYRNGGNKSGRTGGGARSFGINAPFGAIERAAGILTFDQ